MFDPLPFFSVRGTQNRFEVFGTEPRFAYDFLCLAFLKGLGDFFWLLKQLLVELEDV